MTVQDLTRAESTTAEHLLTRMVAPETSDADRARLRELLVRMHERLAKEIANRYRNRGEPMEDLLQAAYVGLVKSINGFDAGLGHDFRGYAAVTMIGEVKRHFRDRTWAVRVPRLYQERRAELNRVTAELTQDLSRAPTVAELADGMAMSQEEVLLVLEASAAYSTLSLDVPTISGEEDSVTLGELLADHDDTLDTLLDAHVVKPLIDALPDREKHILLLRFYGNCTQAEIAAEFGISQMHVSRILRAVLHRLHETLSQQSDPPAAPHVTGRAAGAAGCATRP
ncbi:SigB/SigF/SigG family RNA polymerase sigma factor [Nonomuraea candida]|uniref:SigB/SigF/SigG family RNA polymerase sigma factor n=1 Tax=Nonomuraea candida TaxID=359159 RepID=UPI0009FE9ACD|nr:SigB/SigF/SigG family RNA polymerase sigma factor [Nonomuraea candida]